MKRIKLSFIGNRFLNNFFLVILRNKYHELIKLWIGLALI